MSFISRCPELSLEELYSYIVAGSRDVPGSVCRILFPGDHRRNVCRDINRFEKTERRDEDGRVSFLYLIESGRRSLYDALPEYMFHDVDTFSGIPDRDRMDRFHNECDIIENKTMDARKFLAPLDAVLFNIGLETKERIRKYASSDIILQDIISGNLREECTDNEFIGKLIPFLVYSKFIRGNKVLISMLLRKLLGEEGLKVEHISKDMYRQDEAPRYDVSLEDSLNSVFFGNGFCETGDVYKIHYWSDEECHGDFHRFLEKMEQFRSVVQDYFFSVEDTVEFEICSGDPMPALSETSCCFLNYNTNI